MCVQLLRQLGCWVEMGSGGRQPTGRATDPPVPLPWRGRHRRQRKCARRPAIHLCHAFCWRHEVRRKLRKVIVVAAGERVGARRWRKWQPRTQGPSAGREEQTRQVLHLPTQGHCAALERIPCATRGLALDAAREANSTIAQGIKPPASPGSPFLNLSSDGFGPGMRYRYVAAQLSLNLLFASKPSRSFLFNYLYMTMLQRAFGQGAKTIQRRDTVFVALTIAAWL